MGTTYTEITLKNDGDVADAERGYIKESEIRQITLRVMADTGVDTGVKTLIINEAVRAALGLRMRGWRTVIRAAARWPRR
jgi:hypothetical protein